MVDVVVDAGKRVVLEALRFGSFLRYAYRRLLHDDMEQAIETSRTTTPNPTGSPRVLFILAPNNTTVDLINTACLRRLRRTSQTLPSADEAP